MVSVQVAAEDGIGPVVLSLPRVVGTAGPPASSTCECLTPSSGSLQQSAAVLDAVHRSLDVGGTAPARRGTYGDPGGAVADHPRSASSSRSIDASSSVTVSVRTRGPRVNVATMKGRIAASNRRPLQPPVSIGASVHRVWARRTTGYAAVTVVPRASMSGRRRVHRLPRDDPFEAASPCRARCVPLGP